MMEYSQEMNEGLGLIISTSKIFDLKASVPRLQKSTPTCSRNYNFYLKLTSNSIKFDNIDLFHSYVHNRRDGENYIRTTKEKYAVVIPALVVKSSKGVEDIMDCCPVHGGILGKFPNKLDWTKGTANILIEKLTCCKTCYVKRGNKATLWLRIHFYSYFGNGYTEMELRFSGKLKQSSSKKKKNKNGLNSSEEEAVASDEEIGMNQHVNSRSHHHMNELSPNRFGQNMTLNQLEQFNSSSEDLDIPMNAHPFIVPQSHNMPIYQPNLGSEYNNGRRYNGVDIKKISPNQNIHLPQQQDHLLNSRMHPFQVNPNEIYQNHVTIINSNDKFIQPNLPNKTNVNRGMQPITHQSNIMFAKNNLPPNNSPNNLPPQNNLPPNNNFVINNTNNMQRFANNRPIDNFQAPTNTYNPNLKRKISGEIQQPQQGFSPQLIPQQQSPNQYSPSLHLPPNGGKIQKNSPITNNMSNMNNMPTNKSLGGVMGLPPNPLNQQNTSNLNNSNPNTNMIKKIAPINSAKLNPLLVSSPTTKDRSPPSPHSNHPNPFQHLNESFFTDAPNNSNSNSINTVNPNNHPSNNISLNANNNNALGNSHSNNPVHSSHPFEMHPPILHNFDSPPKDDSPKDLFDFGSMNDHNMHHMGNSNNTSSPPNGSTNNSSNNNSNNNNNINNYFTEFINDVSESDPFSEQFSDTLFHHFEPPRDIKKRDNATFSGIFPSRGRPGSKINLLLENLSVEDRIYLKFGPTRVEVENSGGKYFCYIPNSVSQGSSIIKVNAFFSDTNREIPSDSSSTTFLYDPLEMEFNNESGCNSVEALNQLLSLSHFKNNNLDFDFVKSVRSNNEFNAKRRKQDLLN